MFSLSETSKLSAFPSLCWDSLLEKEPGKKKDSCRPTTQWCCCFLLHDGQAFTILVKLTDWGEGSDTGSCFDFLRLLICKWVGWNPASDVTSRGETTRYMVTGYHLHSVTRDPPWHRLFHLLSWLISQTCFHVKEAFWSVYPLWFFLFIFFYCWMFGLWLPSQFLLISWQFNILENTLSCVLAEN